jgi:hypothetical protein
MSVDVGLGQCSHGSSERSCCGGEGRNKPESTCAVVSSRTPVIWWLSSLYRDAEGSARCAGTSVSVRLKRHWSGGGRSLTINLRFDVAKRGPCTTVDADACHKRPRSEAWPVETPATNPAKRRGALTVVNAKLRSGKGDPCDRLDHRTTCRRRGGP